MGCARQVGAQQKAAPSLSDVKVVWMEKMGGTGKDEAEFILVVGKFKTHNGDHRETDPRDPGGRLTLRAGAHFCKCLPHCVLTECEDPEPRRWVRVGGGREEDRVLPRPCPDHVSDFHRKEEQLSYMVTYRGVESWPWHLGGADSPNYCRRERGAVLVSPRSSSAGWAGAGGWARPPWGPAGVPSILPTGVPRALPASPGMELSHPGCFLCALKTIFALSGMRKKIF